MSLPEYEFSGFSLINLFNTSIRENILLGKPNSTEEELIEASKKAHVIEFVEKFQDGFNTIENLFP